jgi:predicted phage tail protein
VSLSWAAPASDGGSPVTGYNIYRGTSPDGESATPVSGSPVKATSYQVTGLTDGTTYYFTVTAVSAVGPGRESGEASAAPVSPRSTASAARAPGAPGTPGVPARLTVTAGDSQVSLAWAAPASEGGSPVTSYDVYEATTPEFQGSAAVRNVTGTSTTLTGLTDGITYYFMVAAVNAAGNESPFSPQVSAKPAGTVISSQISSAAPMPLVAVLAAVSVAATAGAFALAARGWRRSRAAAKVRKPAQGSSRQVERQA